MRVLLRIALALLALQASCASTQRANDEAASRSENRRRLAHMKLERGQLELAIREYQNALKEWEADPENHFGIAEAYRQKGELALAEQHLLRTLLLAPTHQEARLNLSVVYLQQERWADAVRESSVLIEDPTFLRPVRALVNRGWAHYKSGDFTAAERDLQQAVREESSNHQARLDLGIVLFDKGDVVESIRQLEKVVEQIERRPHPVNGPLEAQARFHLAKGHVKLGQRQKAIQELRAAVKRGGDGEWGQKSKEYLSVLQ
jgi:Tfp pilus assembly protein PilF